MVIGNLYREEDLIHPYKIQTLERGGRRRGGVTASTVGGQNISTRRKYLHLHRTLCWNAVCEAVRMYSSDLSQGGSAADRGRRHLDDQKRSLWDGKGWDPAFLVYSKLRQGYNNCLKIYSYLTGIYLLKLMCCTGTKWGKQVYPKIPFQQLKYLPFESLKSLTTTPHFLTPQVSQSPRRVPASLSPSPAMLVSSGSFLQQPLTPSYPIALGCSGVSHLSQKSRCSWSHNLKANEKCKGTELVLQIPAQFPDTSSGTHPSIPPPHLLAHGYPWQQELKVYSELFQIYLYQKQRTKWKLLFPSNMYTLQVHEKKSYTTITTSSFNEIPFSIWVGDIQSESSKCRRKTCRHTLVIFVILYAFQVCINRERGSNARSQKLFRRKQTKYTGVTDVCSYFKIMHPPLGIFLLNEKLL